MKPKALDFAEILMESGTKEWNEAIASRLEPMRAYLSQDEWKKGASIYFKALIGSGITKFLKQKGEPRDADYLRGFVAALEIVLSLPASIEAQILAEQNKDSAKSDRGTAGY
jgi:hypothetical protein